MKTNLIREILDTLFIEYRELEKVTNKKKGIYWSVPDNDNIKSIWKMNIGHNNIYMVVHNDGEILTFNNEFKNIDIIDTNYCLSDVQRAIYLTQSLTYML